MTVARPPAILDHLSALAERPHGIRNGGPVELVERPLADVNTPADLERAERALSLRP